MKAGKLLTHDSHPKFWVKQCRIKTNGKVRPGNTGKRIKESTDHGAILPCPHTTRLCKGKKKTCFIKRTSIKLQAPHVFLSSAVPEKW